MTKNRSKKSVDPTGSPGIAVISDLPDALKNEEVIFRRLGEGTPAVFLDYDGTLTPIVDTPEQAVLSKEARDAVRRISDRCMVAVLSGRDLEDVRRMVGLPEVIYAGSHGFDVAGPSGEYRRLSRGKKFLPALDRAEKELLEAVKDMTGVRVERKHFAIAVHFRLADPGIVPSLERIVDDVAGRHEDLKKAPGKKIFELRPNTDWDKGKALLSLLDTLHLDSSRAVPLYIGDDATDEDAFKAIAGRGIGIVVGEGARETAATYKARNPSEVLGFLGDLAEMCDGDISGGAWVLSYDGFDPGRESLRESLCAVGNGYFASRATAPQSAADSVHYPGTYLAGCYNRLKSEVEGKTIENESLVNAPNWLPVTFRIADGEWFGEAPVNLAEYRQELDMRAAVLKRSAVLEDGQGRRTRLTQRQLAHMGLCHLACLETVIEPENWSGEIVLRSAIDGRVENSLVRRYRQLNNKHLRQIASGSAAPDLVWLQAETVQSGIGIAEAARTRVFLNGDEIHPVRRTVREDGYVAQEMTVKLGEGETLRVEKIAALFTSRDRAVSQCLLEAREEATRADAFPALRASHVTGWRHLWDRCHINVSADRARVQQILNLHIYHLLQSVSVNSIDLDAGVPPRGLHGEAYRGLIMWDELFIFPFISLRVPDLTRSLLMYRWRRLPEARWAARNAGYRGAMFPWQSGSDGREEAQTLHLNPRSGRWIADNSHLQRHINIALAYNIWHYYQVTGDANFMQFFGAEIVFELARFWASISVHNGARDRYEIRKVMGPDEFHERYPDASEPGIDNNAYTNAMAAWVFCRALDVVEQLPGERRRAIMENIGLERQELARWDEMSRKMLILFHGDGIISQFEGYDDLKEFDWDGYKKKYKDIHRLDRILEAEGDSVNRYKVSKQADVLMLFYLLSADELEELFGRLGYQLDPGAIPRTIEYYLSRTSHGSTLSALVHSWVLARSMREESWNLFRNALESDVSDIQGGTTHEGIHLGAMAGSVDLIQRCYTGLEARRDMLRFNPGLPHELKRIEFNLHYRDHWLTVEVDHRRLRIKSRLEDVGPITVAVGDEITELRAV